MHTSNQFLIRMLTVFLDLGCADEVAICARYYYRCLLLDRSRLHEGEPALHEEDDDGHDEEEEVVDVVRLLFLIVESGWQHL